MNRLLLLLLLLCGGAVAAHAQATVTTVDGTRYVGKLVRNEGDTTVIMTADSVMITIPQARIRLIEFNTGGLAGSSSSTATAVPYWMFGAALGTPAGLNLIFGRSFGGFGMRLSGMVFGGRLYGAQVDVVRIGRTSESFSHQPFLGVGTLHVKGGGTGGGDWTYVAAGYGLNSGGFHFDIGLSVGSGDFSNPQLMLQIGYVHEFF